MDDIDNFRDMLIRFYDLRREQLLFVYNKEEYNDDLEYKWQRYSDNPLSWSLTLSGDSLERLKKVIMQFT